MITHPESQFLPDSFFCEEEDDPNDQIAPYPSPPLLQDMLRQDQHLAYLFLKEQGNLLCSRTEIGACLDNMRRDAVDWILRVVSHYSFTGVTAVLAVNYFDRFILGSHFNGEKKPWMTQLIAVSCLSLAAKFEETHVPLLLDLQADETKYVFEAKTIKRMELFVLSGLEWKMNQITPLSFIHQITKTLPFNPRFSVEFINRCEFLLLFLLSDSRFIHVKPSVMAISTMVYAINTINPSIGEEFQTQLPNILNTDKDKFNKCLEIIEDVYVRSRGFSHHYKKRKIGSLFSPGSPKGVMDFSSNSGDWPDNFLETEPESVSLSPEHPAKKGRINHQSLDN